MRLYTAPRAVRGQVELVDELTFSGPRSVENSQT